MTVHLTSTIDQAARNLDPVTVGGSQPTLAAPSRFVTVVDSGRPIFRVDVHSYWPDCFAFEEAILWRGLVVIGYGSHVHAVSVADRAACTIELQSYFGHLYPTPEFLLIASGERLLRMEPDRSIRWTSDFLGIDGVIVHDGSLSIICGEGEWDPPGGWKPFAVSAADGTVVVHE